MSSRTPRRLPDAAVLRRLFKYNRRTGVLTWGTSGRVAGYINSSDCVVVKVNGQAIYAHRLIWKLVTGKEPRDQIDHKNRVKRDNRWRNLREADGSEQKINVALRVNNTSGHTGIWGRPGRWCVQIKRHDLVNRHVGIFTSLRAAVKARAQAIRRLYGAKWTRVAK